MAGSLEPEVLRDLFKRCRTGTPSQRDTARHELLKLLQPHAYHVALSVLWATPSRHYLAEDLASEALVRFNSHFDKMDPDRAERIVGWLRIVIRRIVIDRSRTAKGKPQELPTDALPDRGQEFDLTRTPHQRSVLLAAVRQLKAEHQEILVLIYWEGLTAPEAAVRLDIVAGTVKSRLHYAIKALREVLEQTHTAHELLELAA